MQAVFDLLSSCRAETNFYRFPSRSRVYIALLREVSCFRYDMAPDDSSRAAYETHARTHSQAGRNSKPRNAGPQYTCLLLRGNELRSHTASALRMSLATALAEPLGETDRSRSDSFFLLEWTSGGRAFLSATARATIVIDPPSSRSVSLQSTDMKKIASSREYSQFFQ